MFSPSLPWLLSHFCRNLHGKISCPHVCKEIVILIPLLVGYILRGNEKKPSMLFQDFSTVTPMTLVCKILFT